jgi:hypothetical protein
LFTRSIICQTIISGYVEDSLSKERLPGVHIYEVKSGKGVVSNSFGFYSITIPVKDSICLAYSYVGYVTEYLYFESEIKRTINISLQKGVLLEEVSINSDQSSLSRPLGKLNISMQQVIRIPSFMGEPDVLRAIQLMPGIQGGKEGSSGIFVRGGSPDQNLILFDDIPLYQVSHIAGFISVFIPDAIKSVDIYKGGFPAKYGGRLASVLDIRSKEGNMNNYSGNVTLGILSSKFTFEGPIRKGETSFLFSIRRSMIDLPVRAYHMISTQGKYSPGYTLFDYNFKLNHIIDTKNRLYFSAYSGRDRLLIKQNDFTTRPDFPFKLKSRTDTNWGNHCFAVRWNHQYNSNLFSNLTIGYLQFFSNSESDTYKTDKDTDELLGVVSNHNNSYIRDFIAKIDYDHYLTNHTLKYGGGIIFHNYNPNMTSIFQSGTSSPIDTSYGTSVSRPLEFYGYIEDQMSIGEKITLNAGLHWFNYWLKDAGYSSLQPRLIASYSLAHNFSINGSYARMAQPVHLLAHSGIGLQTDLWVPSTKKIPPQKSSLYELGLEGRLKQLYNISWSIEGYYKQMTDLIEMKDGETFFSGATNWQEKVVSGGKGSAYGIELLIQKKYGNLTGHLGYTISKNLRIFKDINDGKPFPYRYDRRHDITLSINYAFDRNKDISATWIYTTGKALTLPVARHNLYVLDWETQYSMNYFYADVHIYEGRNSYREPPYHRLDIAINFKKELKRGDRVLSMGIYNVYNRMNPYYLYFDYNDQNELKLYSYTLFPIMPSVSWSYSF